MSSIRPLLLPRFQFVCAVIAGVIFQIFCSHSALAQEQRLTKYVKVRLTADLDHLSENQKKMLVYLMKAGEQMDRAFWRQAYGSKQQLMNTISDPELKAFAEINYGPWNRLENNAPFVEGFQSKPAGANLYPAKLTKATIRKTPCQPPSRRRGL